MATNGTAYQQTAGLLRAAHLAATIEAALKLLGIERVISYAEDSVRVDDVQLNWIERWLSLGAGGGERYAGQAGWEIRLHPSPLPSGIVHNDTSAVQQTVILVVLSSIAPALAALPPATSNDLPASEV